MGRTNRRTVVPVIDVQVHPFDRNHPGRPWASPSHGLESASGDEMVAAMTKVGVDGAIMVSSFSAYRYDPSYALKVYNAHWAHDGAEMKLLRHVKRSHCKHPSYRALYRVSARSPRGLWSG